MPVLVLVLVLDIAGLDLGPLFSVSGCLVLILVSGYLVLVLVSDGLVLTTTLLAHMKLCIVMLITQFSSKMDLAPFENKLFICLPTC